MDALTRTEILHVLKSMGIELPDDTRLSDEALNKRLRDALNASQYKDRLPSSFNLDLLPQWPMEKQSEINTSTRPLLEAVRRGNFHEARQNMEAKAAGKSTVPVLYVDPFMDLRQTVMSIANILDGGLKSCIVQDPEQEKCAINIRVISVKEFNEETPVIVLLYRHFTPATALEGMEWIFEQADSNSSNCVAQVKATPLEQKLLLKIFKLNASLVPSNLVFDRLPIEKQFKVSVLLPVGPLEYESRTKLNTDGCVVCGRKITSRCSQCQSVSYCGVECQRTDWRQHKLACRSIRGGRWCTIATKPSLPGMENQYMAMFNRFRSGGDKENSPYKIDPSAAPPNAWGDKVFLVKLQVGMGTMNPGDMMVYDKKRSFQVFMLRDDNYKVFGDFFAEMLGPRGGHEGLKMYRWAKRTGDWEFSVCLDRQPPATETNW